MHHRTPRISNLLQTPSVFRKNRTNTRNIECKRVRGPQIYKGICSRLIPQSKFSKKILLRQRLRCVLRPLRFIQDINQGRPRPEMDRARLQDIRPVDTFRPGGSFSFNGFWFWRLVSRVCLEERVQTAEDLFHCDHLGIDFIPFRLGNINYIR